MNLLSRILRLSIFRRLSNHARRARLFRSYRVSTMVVQVASLENAKCSCGLLEVRAIRSTRSTLLRNYATRSAIISSGRVVRVQLSTSMNCVVRIAHRIITTITLNSRNARLSVLPYGLLQASRVTRGVMWFFFQ